MKKIKEFFKINLKTLKPTNFIFLLFAGAINAFGVTLFLFPVKLYDSGISGLSMLLDQITPIYLTLSIFLLVFNVPIFIFGYKKEGFAFTIYSLFTVGIYSLFAFLIILYSCSYRQSGNFLINIFSILMHHMDYYFVSSN